MSPALVAAMIAVESGGNANALGRNGEIGALQIRSCVVRDVNRVYGTKYTHAGMTNVDDAVRVASLYIKAYAPGASPEVQARVWNGGPRGATKAATLGYWGRVKRQMGGAK